MPHVWTWLSELGNSKWLLPATAVLIAAAWRCGALPSRTALRWCLAILSTALIVLVSKIAFMGWGIGSAALDFTGISGHAAISACIYPPLFALLGTGRKALRHLPLAGLALAALIAWSRVPLHAHSLSEIVAGFALGATGSALVLKGWNWQRPALPARRWLAVAATSILVLSLVFPSVNTHHAVVALAKTISGRHEIHTRQWLHTHSVSDQPVDIAGEVRHPLGVNPSHTDF